MKRRTLTAPKGAERWERAALNRGFGADRSWVTTLDGSWWWTDGRAMLRCEGEMPPDLEEKPKLRVPAVERRPAQWGPVVLEAFDDGSEGLCRESSDTAACVRIDPKYIGLVEESLPGCVWMIGQWYEPIHALDAEGRLMAIVMGKKPFDLLTEN